VKHPSGCGVKFGKQFGAHEMTGHSTVVVLGVVVVSKEE